MRIGLLGGSFNPPHQGHIHISMAAQKGLMLDCVWWLVTPQNPLKPDKAPDMDLRIDLCRRLTQSHSSILISDLERQLGTNITYYTVEKLRKLFPGTDFVWISGMDNALNFHRWNHWQKLLDLIPTTHLTRKPATSLIRNCPLRMLQSQNHIFVEKAAKYPLQPGNTFWMMQNKMVNISSTEIRRQKATQIKAQ